MELVRELKAFKKELATMRSDLEHTNQDVAEQRDARLRALDVLAEVDAALQVILFTHHGHVVDLAKARLKGQLDLIQL
jgi:hypothetical protein